MRVETFFVGPGKCGTSWVHEYLRLHPQVAVPSIKEPNYWLDPVPEKLERYHGLWSAAPGAHVCEVSNTYCYKPEVARRLAQYNPNARIVFTLRNPVERLASRYLFMHRNGMTTRSLAEVLKRRPELVEHCRYLDVVTPWLDVFARDRVSVLLLEELRVDPHSYARKLCGNLGVEIMDPGKVPLEARLGAARPRSALAARLVKESALLARRLRLFLLIDAVKRSPAMKALYVPVRYDPAAIIQEALSPKEVQGLMDQWREVVALLDPTALLYVS